MNINLINLINKLLKVTLHLNVTIISPPYENYSFFDKELRATLYQDFNYKHFFQNMVSYMKPHSVYSFCDHFGSYYAFFSVPEDKDSMLIIGPYLIDEITTDFINKIIESSHLTSTMVFPLQQYYHSLPLLDSHTIISTINEVASILYGGTNTYSVFFRNEYWEDTDYRETNILPNPELILNMELMEEKYLKENTLLSCVVKGDRRSAIAAFHDYSKNLLGNGITDSTRELKVQAITLNTLYRKSAEKTCVHPIYLDEIFTKYTTQIEQSQSVPKLNNVMLEMTRNYCDLVKAQSLKDYSLLIRKTIDYINLNLSSPLSLHVLAETFSVNSSYLSSLFKKELGITLTEYINRQRIEAAIQLLNSTDMNIQTISWYVGIQDVNYFSRLFKKITTMTPTTYKQNLKMDNKH